MRYGCREAEPFLGLGGEPFPSLRGQSIELHLPIELGYAPLGLDEALALHPVKSRVERTLLDLHHFARHVLDRSRNRIAVPGACSQRLQDQNVESAVKEVGFARHGYT